MKNGEKTIISFMDELSSDMPAPGGGGAAALVGAVGISLGNMVASLTIGKPKFADVEDELKMLSKDALAIRDELITLIDKDAEGFLPLIEAYKLPADSEAEKAHKEAEIERLSIEACNVPMQIIEKCNEALDIVKVFADKGSKMAASDAACAAVMLKAAVEAASLNVFINTKYLKDRDRAGKLNDKANGLVDVCAAKGDGIYNRIVNNLKI